MGVSSLLGASQQFDRGCRDRVGQQHHVASWMRQRGGDGESVCRSCCCCQLGAVPRGQEAHIAAIRGLGLCAVRGGTSLCLAVWLHLSALFACTHQLQLSTCGKQPVTALHSWSCRTRCWMLATPPPQTPRPTATSCLWCACLTQVRRAAGAQGRRGTCAGAQHRRFGVPQL